MSSTFDGLYIARSGVRTSRVNLNIAGQNITNATTEGYTRQRVDQSSIPAPYGSLYAQNPGDSYGQGSIATGINQIRDAFLDSEYRTQNAKAGQSSVEYDALSSLEDIFTYTTTSKSSSSSAVVDVLSNEFSNFISQLQNLTSGKSGASESAIREEAKLLATKFNTAAQQLQTVWNQQYTSLNDYGVKQVNDMLKNISQLNGQIKRAEVSGTPALELRDQRNLMLDKLSQYVGIKVTETPVDNGSGTKVNELTVTLADPDGNSLGYKLIDNDQYAEFSVSKIPADEKAADGIASTSSYSDVEMHLSGLTTDGNFAAAGEQLAPATYNITLVTGTPPATTTTTGSIDTSSFSLAAPPTMDELKDAVQTALNDPPWNGSVTVANVNGALQFTTASGGTLSVEREGGLNSELQSGSFPGYLALLNESGEFDTASGGATTTTRGIGYYSQLLDTIAANLADAVNAVNSTNDAGDNKPLLTQNGTLTDHITAANIQLASAWTTGYLTTSKDTANAGDSTNSSYSNITNMIVALTTSEHTLRSSKGVDIYTGTIQKAVSNVATTLGQDVNSVNSTDATNSTILNSIDTSRQSNSSVSIDDEAIDLVQFNQALTAASRFMTAVDECLQTIISSMGVAGRG